MILNCKVKYITAFHGLHHRVAIVGHSSMPYLRSQSSIVFKNILQIFTMNIYRMKEYIVVCILVIFFHLNVNYHVKRNIFFKKRSSDKGALCRVHVSAVRFSHIYFSCVCPAQKLTPCSFMKC